MKHSLDAGLPEKCSLEQVKQVMDKRGYAWAHRIPAEELQLAEEIWRLPDDRGAVRYVYDHILEVPFFRAESDIHGEPTKILIDLQNDLPFLYIEDFLLEAEAANPGRRYALRALAVITTMYRGDVIAAFKAAIVDSDPTIRKLALICVARYPAFSFAKELDTRAAVESDPDLKERQLKLAGDLRAHGKRGTLW